MTRRTDPRGAPAARRRCLTGALLAGAAAAIAPAGAQHVEYSGAVQGATGTYLFTERTTSLTLLNGLTIAAGPVRLSASLPLVFQNSSAVTFIGGTPVPTGGPDARAVRERQPGTRVPMGGRGGQNGQGTSASRAMLLAAAADGSATVAEPGSYEFHVGDPLIELGVDLQGGSGVLRSFGLQALAKAPVADVSSGIGTGEWDYGAGASASLGSRRTFLLTSASFWRLGDMPDLPLRDIVTYAASVGRMLGDRWSLMGSFSGATAAFDNADAPASLGVALGYAPDPSRGVMLGVSAGLSESAPDFSTYLGWRLALGGRRF